MMKENSQQRGRGKDPGGTQVGCWSKVPRGAGGEGPKEQRAESPSVPGKSLGEDTGCELEERCVFIDNCPLEPRCTVFGSCSAPVAMLSVQ